MKVVILAGGLGTRISEETEAKPKPMIEIGGKPIIWHIMKMYSHYGFNDFIVCCGYKGYVIKEYFSNYYLHQSDVTIDLKSGQTTVLESKVEDWRVTLIDTGDDAMTGGRLLRVASLLDDDSPFMFTYGDGVADLDIRAELEFHLDHGKLATVCGVIPPGRFGAMSLEGDTVVEFKEKPAGEVGLINGGFFILSKKCVELISDPSVSWEEEPLRALALAGELKVFRHDGFWQPMDTLRDKRALNAMIDSDCAPWIKW